MYELVPLSEHDYYIDSPTKIGLVKISENEVVAIDSGNDKDAGKKVFRILEANGWQLKAIYNTHAHADHIGGNRFLQDKTGCRVFARGLEASFATDPILEPVSLYGGSPYKELRNKFLLAQESKAERLTAEHLPAGWEMLELPGHSFEMVGFRTPDNNIFLADALASRETLEKYGVVFLWDVEAYRKTLQQIMTMKAAKFVPAHAPVEEDIAPLAQMNLELTDQTADTICAFCTEPIGFDALLARVFDAYHLTMSAQQHVLVGSTVRSYLAWMVGQGRISYHFENNVMLWNKIE